MVRSRASFASTAAAAAFWLLAAAFGQASAHEIWTAGTVAENGTLEAHIGYGHNFPEPEPIEESERALFELPSAFGPDGKVEMEPDESGFKGSSPDPVPSGAYLLVMRVKPSMWSTGPNGWVRGGKTGEVPVTRCGNFVDSAKAVVLAGSSGRSGPITEPQGEPLEIVPLSNPASIKAGDALGVEVLLEGRPLPEAKLSLRSAKPDSEASSQTAGPDGRAEITVPRPGSWIVRVRYKTAYRNPEVCDENDYGASLFFTVP